MSKTTCDWSTLGKQRLLICPRYVYSVPQPKILAYKTGSESIEATLHRRRILFARFVARMKNTRLPKYVMFGRLVGGAGCVGARKKSGRGVFWTTSEISTSTPTSGRQQPRTRGNGAEWRNKGRNISWRSGSLQRMIIHPRQREGAES